MSLCSSFLPAATWMHERDHGRAGARPYRVEHRSRQFGQCNPAASTSCFICKMLNGSDDRPSPPRDRMQATGVCAYLFLALILISSEAQGEEPLYDGLGSYTRKISTKSAEAQKYFDQGINFYFGFNHSDALRAFQAADTLDPGFAMNYWGAALACDGDINFPGFLPGMADLAWKQIQLAREHAVDASPVEQAFIEAFASRYT